MRFDGDFRDRLLMSDYNKRRRSVELRACLAVCLCSDSPGSSDRPLCVFQGALLVPGKAETRRVRAAPVLPTLCRGGQDQIGK